MTSVLPLVMHRYKVIQEVPKIPKTEVIHNDSYLKKQVQDNFWPIHYIQHIQVFKWPINIQEQKPEITG